MIGPLNKKFGTKNLLVISSIVTGIGLVLIPLGDTSNPWPYIIFILCFDCRGNGIFQPSANTIATEYAREQSLELGMVMGSVGAAGAFARVLGPITGGAPWTITRKFWHKLLVRDCVCSMWIVNVNRLFYIFRSSSYKISIRS